MGRNGHWDLHRTVGLCRGNTDVHRLPLLESIAAHDANRDCGGGTVAMKTIRMVGVLVVVGLFVLAGMAVVTLSMGVSFARAGELESVAAFGWLLPIADLIEKSGPLFLVGLALCSFSAAVIFVKLLEALFGVPDRT